MVHFFSFLFSFSLCCMLGIIVLFMGVFECVCDCVLVIIGWDGMGWMGVFCRLPEITKNQYATAHQYLLNLGFWICTLRFRV